MENQMQSKNKNRKANKVGIDITKFTYNNDHSVPQRAAHFLVWAAKYYPKEYIPYNVMHKAILGGSKIPRLESPEVESLRGKIHRIREILQKNFKRDIDAIKGIGVRATVDDGDTLITSLPKKMRRLESAKNSVAATVGIINSNNIPSTSEYIPWKKWLNSSVKNVVKTLEGADFNNRLLPAASNEEEL